LLEEVYEDEEYEDELRYRLSQEGPSVAVVFVVNGNRNGNDGGNDDCD
jgi:hypothetical protein